jgi:DNA-directed RNA polymerase specialized sigma24 family protein
VSSRPEYGNAQIKALIMDVIHDKTDRKMLYLRLVDGDTIAEISEKVGLDEKTVWRRLHKGEKQLFSHLPG